MYQNYDDYPMSDYERACEAGYCGPSPSQERAFRDRYRCSDGFCGAEDCSRCGSGPETYEEYLERTEEEEEEDLQEQEEAKILEKLQKERVALKLKEEANFTEDEIPF